MDLRARFCDLWGHLGATGDPGTAFDDLIARYREPHRRYHNEAHLAFGLGQFDLLADTALHPDCVEFAFYYHDIVYAIGAAENEERSAALAVDTLKKVGVPGEVRSVVRDCILVTTPGASPRPPINVSLRTSISPSSASSGRSL